jgi:hypothetical protein
VRMAGDHRGAGCGVRIRPLQLPDHGVLGDRVLVFPLEWPPRGGPLRRHARLLACMRQVRQSLCLQGLHHASGFPFVHQSEPDAMPPGWVDPLEPCIPGAGAGWPSTPRSTTACLALGALQAAGKPVSALSPFRPRSRCCPVNARDGREGAFVGLQPSLRRSREETGPRCAAPRLFGATSGWATWRCPCSGPKPPGVPDAHIRVSVTFHQSPPLAGRLLGFGPGERAEPGRGAMGTVPVGTSQHVARACQPSLRARPHPGCSTDSWLAQRGGGGYMGCAVGGMLARGCGIRMSLSHATHGVDTAGFPEV